MDIEWTKITAIICITVLAGLLVLSSRADLGANLAMAVLAYLFGNATGKALAKREK